MSKTILTGLRANSSLTLGNYLGAILPMVQIQQNLASDDKFFMFIPDLHSFVTPVDHTSLYQAVLDNAKTYIASGIDPNHANTYLYRQSHVPAHSEMNWILSCFTYYGEASRMIQFKEKATQQGQNVSVGLFTYPILMAGDILLYNADYIPLGEDQKQHLELTRDVAIRINNKFDKAIFNIPKPWKDQLEFANRQEGVKIRSLSNPEVKMSKSVSDPKGTILLSDKPEEAYKKIMSATTDNLAKMAWDWENQPGITNLLQIAGLLGDKGISQEIADWTGKERYGDFKKYVAEIVQNFLTNFQTKLSNISDEEVEDMLTKHEIEANKIANQTLLKAQQAVGLKR